MTRFERFLVPTDGSEVLAPALQRGFDLAVAVQASITALYVVDTAGYAQLPGDIGLAAIREGLQGEATRALGALEVEATARGLPFEGRTMEGDPADAILRTAPGFDLIVMAHHGRKGLDHLLMGSVTEKVIRHTSVPVLVVRIAPGAAEETS